MTFGDLAEDRKIDSLKLDEECAIQASRYGYWADKYAEAKNDLDASKMNMDAVTASRSLFYRRNPPLDLKATEAVFSSLIDDDREVQEAKEELHKAQATVNTLYSAVSSIEQVKSELDNLVKLQGMKYYGTQEGSYDASIQRMRG